MKVNHPTSAPSQAGEASGAKQGERAGSAKEVRRAHGSPASKAERAHKNDNEDVKTEISGKAREAAMAREVASKTPDVREDRVADLRHRIASGQYEVDADAVADRMVNEHLKMS